MDKIILGIIILLAVIAGFSGIQEQQAWAFSGTISDQASCQSAGGTWTAPDTCTVNGITVSAGETMTIPGGVMLTVNGDILNNGSIINDGTVTVTGNVNNGIDSIGGDGTGTIDNTGGTITVTGNVNNGIGGSSPFGSGFRGGDGTGTIDNAGGTITVTGNVNNGIGGIGSFFRPIGAPGCGSSCPPPIVSIGGDGTGTIDNTGGTITVTGNVNNGIDSIGGRLDGIGFGTITNTDGTINIDCTGILIGTIPTSGNPVVQESCGGGGSSANKHLQRPTFGLSHHTHQQTVNDGFTANGKPFDVTDNWHTDFEKQTITTGEINTFAAKAYSPYGLQSVEFMFGLPEVGQAHKAEAAVEVWLNRDVTVEKVLVAQKDNLINAESVTASAKMVPCTDSDSTNNCYSVEISASFNEAPIHDVFALKGMDFTRRTHTTHLNDGFAVLGESLNPPKTETASLGQSGTIQLMTQIDRKNNLWQDENGYQWTKNSFDTWLQITRPDLQRHQDELSTVMTRDNSNFVVLVDYEKQKATAIFDSTILQKELPDTFAYTYPDKFENKLDDPELQKRMISEENRAMEQLEKMSKD